MQKRKPPLNSETSDMLAMIAVILVVSLLLLGGLL
jgi:hypothetical protein